MVVGCGAAFLVVDGCAGEDEGAGWLACVTGAGALGAGAGVAAAFTGAGWDCGAGEDDGAGSVWNAIFVGSDFGGGFAVIVDAEELALVAGAGTGTVLGDKDAIVLVSVAGAGLAVLAFFTAGISVGLLAAGTTAGAGLVSATVAGTLRNFTIRRFACGTNW
jgi:hypothetical protein